MSLFAAFERIMGRARDPEEKIAALHQQAAAVAPAKRGARWVEIARLCLRHAQTHRALGYYGRAIDDFLLTGLYEEGAQLCHEVIRAFPSVVRARCTLAFLSMRGGYSSAFVRDLSDYLRAARQAGETQLALTRLRMMAGVTSDGAVRRFLDRQILALGESIGQEQLGATMYSREGRPLLPIPGDQEERWAFVLRLSIAGPTSDREQAGLAPAHSL